MIKERRDNKGRLLNTGESQIRNGSYIYRYTDADGVRRSITSWRLEPSDRGPNNTSDQESLREIEARIKRSMMLNQPPITDDKLTVNDFWERYISMKCEIAESTLVGYIYLYNHHVRQNFGKRKIKTVKYSELKKFYIDKIRSGLNISSISNLHNIMNPLFELAVREGYIPTNPARGLLGEFQRRKDWGQTTREALTLEEQTNLVEFVSKSYEFKQFRPIITMFLGTGMRCGELIGLRWEDVNFEKNIISVNHTLNYDIALDGKCQYYITFPKTKAGIREIPMLADVRETLLEMYKRRLDVSVENQVVIDGYTNFVFKDLYGCVYSNQRINSGLKRIQKKYNAEERERAQKENREPRILPNFTCHHLRHTFCTRLCEANSISLKYLQYLMGHSHPGTTLKVYSSVNAARNQEEMASLEGKFRIR